MKNSLLSLILIFLFIITGLIIYGLFFQPTEIGVSNQFNTNQIISDENTADWETYSDDKNSFSIQYPADWYVFPWEKAVGFGPATLEESGDYQWGVLVYSAQTKTIEQIIADIGDQFADRQEAREEVLINGLPAIKVIVTTASIPDWYAEFIIIENDSMIYSISNGAIQDELYTQFYQSFKITR